MCDQNNIDPKIKEIAQGIHDIFSMCSKCAHKNVCKYIQERDHFQSTCEDYLSSNNPKIYGNIYSMFEPVFKWIQHHYPSEDVKFVVERHGAQMYLPHGVFASSEALKKFSLKNIIEGGENED